METAVPVEVGASASLIGCRSAARSARPRCVVRGAMQDPGMDIFFALRQRLKLDRRTRPEMLAAAVDMALDRKLLPTKACADRKLPAGSHSRAKALADRIVSNGLLGLCTPDPQDAPTLPLVISNLSHSLLLQQKWISDHAPSLCDVTAGPLVLTPDGREATRTISYRLDGQDELLSSSIDYVMPTSSSDHKLFADRNRRKEEAAILALDSSAAANHRAKRARMQQGLREQRQFVDEDKVLRSVLERLISELEQQAHIQRSREEQTQRLYQPGRDPLHIGDLIYVRHPDYPSPHLQLAVLRRVHRSGEKADVQLCHFNPPEMGVKGVDRIGLDGMLRGLSTQSVVASVVPRERAVFRNRSDQEYRKKYPREFWPIVQLWLAAAFAERQSSSAHVRRYELLQSAKKVCKCPRTPHNDSLHAPQCSLILHRVPRLFELASAALPLFLDGRSAQWRCATAPFKPDEIERAAERSYIRPHDS